MDKDELPDELPTGGDQRTFETQYAGRPPSIALIETIAAIEGVQSPDVSFTLNESIDPDSLDVLFADRKTENDVVAKFHVDDYAVEVNADGTLTVKAPEDTE